MFLKCRLHTQAVACLRLFVSGWDAVCTAQHYDTCCDSALCLKIIGSSRGADAF